MSEGVMHQVMGWDTLPANLINAEYQTEKGSFYGGGFNGFNVNICV